MITEKQYNEAIIQKEEAQKSINLYHKEQNNVFDERMKNNPIFTDDELTYSAFNFCPCGHGLAYPKGCSMQHYWDCSAILKGIANFDFEHTAKLPFSFYSIRGENEKETTRGIFLPREKSKI